MNHADIRQSLISLRLQQSITCLMDTVLADILDILDVTRVILGAHTVDAHTCLTAQGEIITNAFQ